MIPITKTIDELNSLSYQRLTDSGLSISSGRIAKLLLSILNENIIDFYTNLQSVNTQAYVSTATGQSLDLIGQLLNVTRLSNETDNDFRYRITQQTSTIASANETAIRLALLSITGIDEVIMKPYTHGTGSFSVYIISNTTTISDTLIQEAQTVVDQVKGFGIKATVYKPIYVPVEIKMRLTFSKNVSEIDKKIIRTQAETLIRNYISNLMVGASINTSSIESSIQALSGEIVSMTSYEFIVAGRPSRWSNQDIQWNEKFVQSANSDAILVS